jgi:hypothetical protein
MRDNRKRIIALLYFALCIFLIFFSACGSGSGTSQNTSSETGSIGFSVEWNCAPTIEISSASIRGASLDCQAAGVFTVEGRIYDEDNTFLAGDERNCEAHSGRITGVRAGANRKLVIAGKNPSGNVLYRGEVTGITVTAGQRTSAGTIVADLFNPTLLTPSDGSTVTNGTFSFEWASVIGTSEYQIQVSPYSGFTSTVIDETITITSYAPTTTLSVGTHYWRVKAKDAYGSESQWSEVWDFTISAEPGTAPSEPENVSTISGNQEVTISWDTVAGATSYSIYMNTSTGVSKTSFTEKRTVTTTSYTWTDLTNDTTYYYVVTAENDYGESGESSEVSAMPATPIAEWLKLLGTSGQDNGCGIAVDSNGYIYVTGEVQGDILITKYNANGNLQWTELLGTSGADLGIDIAVDSIGNSFVTGYTSGNLDGNMNAGGQDIFVSKYNTNGTKQWTKLLGTSQTDEAIGIALDSNSNIYITGGTSGDLDGNTNAGGTDIFVSKYDTSGTRQWTQLLGTSADDKGYDIALDSSVNIYITGETYGDLGGTNKGPRDIFIAKYNANGNLQWTELLGTSADEYAYGIAVDSDGNIYITGHTGAALDDNNNAGGDDAFIAKYDTNGTKQWTGLLGTPGRDQSHEVVVGPNGYLYITGLTGGDLDGNTNAGAEDIFVSKYDTNGNRQWTELLGTSADDIGRGIAVHSDGSIYSTGQTTGHLDGNTNAGGWDIFIWKLVDLDI